MSRTGSAIASSTSACPDWGRIFTAILCLHLDPEESSALGANMGYSTKTGTVKFAVGGVPPGKFPRVTVGLPLIERESAIIGPFEVNLEFPYKVIATEGKYMMPL